MTVGFNKGVGIMIIIITTPFEMCKEACIIFRKMIDRQLAIF